MILPNNVYDTLAWCGRILLPALSVFYGTVGDIWHLPYVNEIPLTIMALDTLLNALLGIGNKKFFEEHEIVENTVNNKDVDQNG